MTRWFVPFGLMLTAGVVGCAADAETTVPATVLLLRHAEKPPEGEPSVHLSATGRARADALPRLFRASDARPDPLPTPDFLFAAADSRKSSRSTETLVPLAKALHLTIRAPLMNDDFAQLARHIRTDPKYAGKTVLICWHQGTMPRLARALGATDAPADWKNAVFDRVWRIDYAPDGETTFRALPQALLPDDATR